MECGRVLALMRGRYHLSVEDVQHVAPAVLRHRIILNFDAHADGQTPETILTTDHQRRDRASRLRRVAENLAWRPRRCWTVIFSKNSNG